MQATEATRCVDPSSPSALADGAPWERARAAAGVSADATCCLSLAPDPVLRPPPPPPPNEQYSRSANPNRRNLEEALASLEGGAEAFAFASGSAATATAVQALASADPTKVRKHVLAVNDVYGGTFRYLARVATEVQSLETTFLDLEASTEQEIYDAIREDTGVSAHGAAASTPTSLLSLPLPLPWQEGGEKERE